MKPNRGLILLLLASLLLSACSPTIDDFASSLTSIEMERVNMTNPNNPTDRVREGAAVIYLAGGCFWGLEKLMESMPGVLDAVSGYANGNAEVIPNYQSVSSGKTGYRETVRVEYDPAQISLDALLFAFFEVIDPTIKNAQGHDIGTQYQSGIYYPDETSGEIVNRIAEIYRNRFSPFAVEIAPFERFYEAEDYHQDYLANNPGGYCHISLRDIDALSQVIVDPGRYPRPSDEQIRKMLSDEQYNITQQHGTERAFQNQYWDNHAHGLYVDIVTGEPLFSSRDKFDSGTGWPSFSRGIDENAFFLVTDTSHGMLRTEARSRAGDTHLGHVFYNEPSSPSGTRYCMNSASLRFIPYEEMENEGYGYLLEYVK